LYEKESWRRGEFSGKKFQPRSAKEKGMNSKTLCMALFLMTISSDTLWIFPVDEFVAAFQQPGATQKSGGADSSLKLEIARLFEEGIAREDACDLEGAIEINKKILQLDPGNKYAMNIIAGLFGKLREFEQEITWTRKAIDIDPQFDLAYINYSSALIGLKRYNEAADACKKAIQINPENPYGVYNLGVIEEENGNFKKALEFYWQSIQIDPEFENGYFNLATMYANLRQYDKAIAALKTLIELNPNAEEAKAMLLRIERIIKRK